MITRSGRLCSRRCRLRLKRARQLLEIFVRQQEMRSKRPQKPKNGHQMRKKIWRRRYEAICSRLTTVFNSTRFKNWLTSISKWLMWSCHQKKRSYANLVMFWTVSNWITECRESPCNRCVFCSRHNASTSKSPSLSLCVLVLDLILEYGMIEYLHVHKAKKEN